MKTILAACLFATLLPASALAENQLPAACGPAGTNFEANEDPSQYAPARPEAGKALVYLILDDGPGGNYQHFTLRAGMDGAWVGAYKHNSYIAALVTPGEHHVCVNVQSNFAVGKQVALAHFVAEAGKTYYFRTRYMGGVTTPNSIFPVLDLDRLDSDQGDYLVGLYPVGTWKEKK